MPKIVIVSTGSVSFGLNTLDSLLNCKKLRGSAITLVDINPDASGQIARLTEHINPEWDSEMVINNRD